jgi:hypothetical protein
LHVTQEARKRLYERCGFRDDGRREPLAHAAEVVEIGMSRALA